MLNKLLFFDSMITPKIIQLIFWIASVLIILSGFGIMAAGNTLWAFLLGLLVIFLGPLLVRVWCEILIVKFKINENLQILKDKYSGEM
ncbi:MAG: DUF4282 domain-containing protein [Syntrophomonadaceae bacterium]|nr:DUF4282 domain-containing protein [Syntrophomonadaceae bacterium]